MDFEWTGEQNALYENAVAFAQRTLNADLAQRDIEARFEMKTWLDCAQFGILGWCMPVEYGGGGYDVLTTIRMLEGIGYGCRDNGLTLGLNGQIWSVQEPLLRFGTPAQKLKFLPQLCSGKLLAAHGMTEDSSGSDAFSLSTTAEKVEGGYLLNGRKNYIGLAPVAGLALVFANTNPADGRWGVSAFLVEAQFEGFQAEPAQSKMGLRTSPLGAIQFSNCFVPDENRLGPEGIGVSIFTHSMEWERSFIFASHVGSMARQLEACVAYSGQRQQFGETISGFQSVSNRIANMRLRLETSRLLLYKLAWKMGRGDQAVGEAAMAKLHISEAFVANSTDAIRIGGARGYMSEYEIERDLRDAMGGIIYSGTSDIQRNIIASTVDMEQRRN